METRKIVLTVLVMLAASALIAGTSLLAKALGTEALGPALHQARHLAALRAGLGGVFWRHLHVCRLGAHSAGRCHRH